MNSMSCHENISRFSVKLYYIGQNVNGSIHYFFLSETRKNES